MSDPRTEAEAIRDITFDAADGTTLIPGEVRGWIVPDNHALEIEDFEHLLDAPRRKRTEVNAHTLDALIAYVTAHPAEPRVTVWVDREGQQVVAILNDHDEDAPGWRDHRVVMRLRPTPAWEHWAKNDGRLLGQEAFAEHIEDGLSAIVEPAAAEMLEVAQHVQATTTATFRGVRRLDNGQVAAAYEEVIDAKAGRKADLTVPSEFALALAPYYGEPSYRVTARLRYRLRAGELTIGYRLVEPWKVLDDALRGIADKLNENIVGTTYLGSPG